MLKKKISEAPFYKYHALGNDYIVLDASDVPELSPRDVIHLCHRNCGIGSDGILLYHGQDEGGAFPLTIYNPDGGLAEKSGNGLRIFSRFLWDMNLVADEPFVVIPEGGLVRCQIFDEGREVQVEMGHVNFDSPQIPVAGNSREVLNESIEVDGERITFSAASIGNPHGVVLTEQLKKEDALRFGSYLENHNLFPNRINVQFMKVVDRNTLAIEIWERGAGYTLASGSSSCACAAIARKLDLCDENITVKMPGGELAVHCSDDFKITIRGSVTQVASGTFSKELYTYPLPEDVSDQAEEGVAK